MSAIVNQDGSAVGYLTLDMVDGDIVGPVVLSVTAASGRTLKLGQGDASAPISASARVHGSGAAPVSLSVGLDLTPFAPGEVLLDVTFAASLPAGRVRESVYLFVDDGAPAAGWSD